MDDKPRPTATTLPPRVLRFEVITVLLVVVLPWIAGGAYHLLQYLVTGTRSHVLGAGVLDPPALDVGVECLLLVAGSMGVVLVAYVLSRSGESLGTIGLRLRPAWRNLGLGAAFAVLLLVVAGVAGVLIHGVLGIRSFSRAAPLNLGLGYLPVGLLSALRAGVVEEVVVCGYLISRLRQAGWSDRNALYTSTGVRAAYHVYGGVFLVCFTVIFGLILGRYYERTHRLTVIVMAHFLYDAVLFTLALAR